MSCYAMPCYAMPIFNPTLPNFFFNLFIFFNFFFVFVIVVLSYPAREKPIPVIFFSSFIWFVKVEAKGKNKIK